VDWIRGGTWEVGRLRAVAVRAAVEVETEAMTLESALHQAREELAAARFIEDPETWSKVIGSSGDWQRYSVRERLDSALRAAQKVAERVKLPEAPVYSDGCTPVEGAALAWFLHAFGPLGPVVGLIEPVQPSPLERRYREVDLLRMRDQLHELASATEAVALLHRGEGARHRERIWAQAEPYLREVAVWPVRIDGRLGYRVLPVTLRAALWSELIRRGGGGIELRCKVCGRELPRRLGRGRQREFCDEHSAEKFRRAFNRRSLLSIEDEEGLL